MSLPPPPRPSPRTSSCSLCPTPSAPRPRTPRSSTSPPSTAPSRRPIQRRSRPATLSRPCRPACPHSKSLRPLTGSTAASRAPTPGSPMFVTVVLSRNNPPATTVLSITVGWPTSRSGNVVVASTSTVTRPSSCSSCPTHPSPRPRKPRSSTSPPGDGAYSNCQFPCGLPPGLVPPAASSPTASVPTSVSALEIVASVDW